MSIPVLLTNGLGNGTFTTTIPLFVLEGYSIGEVAIVYSGVSIKLAPESHTVKLGREDRTIKLAPSSRTIKVTK